MNRDSISVLIEIKNNRVSSLSLELLGKGLELAKKSGKNLIAIVIDEKAEEFEKEILEYGVDFVCSYTGIDEKSTANVYANILEKFIKTTEPSILLVGENDFGKNIAGKIAVRFNTGLTTECIDLDINNEGLLLQRKPIGGGVVAEMICEGAKPQIATVKKSVMNMAQKVQNPQGGIIKGNLKDISLEKDFEILEKVKKEISLPIDEAEVLVVAGRGFKTKEDLEMAKALAKKLNGEFAVSRPLVQMGWAEHSRQVGISGTIVKPRLIITLGVSGAIQFTLGMDKSMNIIAINNDKDAEILKIANYGIVGDMYEIIPELLK